MLSEEEKNRYDRHISLEQIGTDGQLKLKASSVLVVGVGGLGCPVAEYLTAAGVGTIGLIDHDVVEESNLQRQVLYTVDDIGKPKVEAAKARLEAMNPNVTIEIIQQALDADLALELFKNYDVIVDGTDNFQSKYLINDASLLTGKPMVSASIYKFQGQLSVFNYKDGPSYRCLFPEHHELDANNCIEAGVIGVLPGMLGTMQASEVLKIILQVGEVHSGKLKLVDTLTLEDQIISFERNEDQIELVKNHGIKAMSIECEVLQITDEAMYLDVREPFEMPQLEKDLLMHIPLNQLSERYEEIPKDQDIVVCCQSGLRSRKAISYLRDNFGYQNLTNLEGGIQKLES